MATANTPRFGFRYPNGDDPLSNGDDVIQYFAEQVDSLLWSWYTHFTTVYSFMLQSTTALALTASSPVYPTWTSGTTLPGGVTPPYNLSTGITIPVDGVYEIKAWGYFDPASVADTVQVRALYTRPNEAEVGFWNTASMPGSSWVDLTTSQLVICKANTTVRTQVTAFNGTATLAGHQLRITGPVGGGPTASTLSQLRTELALRRPAPVGEVTV